MKKIYNSLIYCGALLSLMSTNVYAIRALYPGEKDWRIIFEKQDNLRYIFVNILSVLVTIYIISLIIYLIKSKKDLKPKIKRVRNSFVNIYFNISFDI